MKRFHGWLPSVLCVACSASPIGTPTGSAGVAVTKDGAALYVANADHGSLARYDIRSGRVDHVMIDGEPTSVARLGDRIFVSLRAARSLAVYEAGAVETVEVGAEPCGVVADESSDRVYVAASLGDEVVELDGTTLQVTRRWRVRGEPRGLALHPSGASLFVATHRSRELLRIDLHDSGATPVPVRLPEALIAGRLGLVLRLTGDPAVSPDGGYVYVPGVYVDTLTPILLTPASVYYDEQQFLGGSMGVVLAVPVDERGAPAEAEAGVISVADFATNPAVTGYPSHVAVSPDADLLAVAIEGASAVVVVGARHDASDENLLRDVPSAQPFVFRGGRYGSFEPRSVRSARVPAGARSIVFTADDEAFVHGFIDRAITRIDVGDLEPPSDDIRVLVASRTLEAPEHVVEVAPEVLSPQVADGRRLFFTTIDPAISRMGTGLSCAVCHPDGRDDGLTWTFSIGPRQTPSLAGVVSLTAPVRWEGERATVAENVQMTARGMSGTSDLTNERAAQVAAFIDWTRLPDVPGRHVPLDMVARGRKVFERVGCASCHAGPALTDNAVHPMLGLERVRTRSLVGVSATAPYFHTGRADSLSEVIDYAARGEMGAPFTIDESEKADLVRYLESL